MSERVRGCVCTSICHQFMWKHGDCGVEVVHDHHHNALGWRRHTRVGGERIRTERKEIFEVRKREGGKRKREGKRGGGV